MTAPIEGTVRIVTRSAAETRALAADLAVAARPGDRIALRGELGVGKTQFAKGFAVGLGIAEVVMSPTFTLMAEYAGRLRLFHLDLYRVSGLAEAYEGGLLDERQAEGVTVIEWAERLDPVVDPDRLEVALVAGPGAEDRTIAIGPTLPRYAAYLERARAWAPPQRR